MEKESDKIIFNDITLIIAQIIKEDRENSFDLISFWKIGKQINASLKKVDDNIKYKTLLNHLSKNLENQFGKKYSLRNIKRMVNLAVKIQDLSSLKLLSKKVGWSHIIELLPLNKIEDILFLASLSFSEKWTPRQTRYYVKCYIHFLDAQQILFFLDPAPNSLNLNDIYVLLLQSGKILHPPSLGGVPEGWGGSIDEEMSQGQKEFISLILPESCNNITSQPILEEQYQPDSNNATIEPSLKSIFEGKSRHFRNSKNYFNLPFNSHLKQRAKDLRKTGNLSEIIFWKRVKNKQFKGFDFDRQKIVGNYIVDFYCSNCSVVIEIDGSSHNDKAEYDARRDKYLQSLGLTVIHISVSDIFNNINNVMQMLFEHPALKGTPLLEGNLNNNLRSINRGNKSYITMDGRKIVLILDERALEKLEMIVQHKQIKVVLIESVFKNNEHLRSKTELLLLTNEIEYKIFK